MGVNISYMGTKKELAPVVCDVIRHAQHGVLLDAFSGMCSVGEHVGTSRQVWSNDIQIFAAQTAQALFTSRDEAPGAILSADLHFDFFKQHKLLLQNKCSQSIIAEKRLLESEQYPAFTKHKELLAKTLAYETLSLNDGDYNLFTRLYANSYFGVAQAIGIDSIIKSINIIHDTSQSSSDHKRWFLIALGRAMLKIANSTGHFAQFLKPKPSIYRKFIKQRQRDIWEEWLFSLGELHAVGTADWRRANKSFNCDSLTLLPRLAKQKEKPSVIYADPPYTDDQYSRYYHIFETLILYDYPQISGAGLYRPNRFRTPFSLKSRAAQAFEDLVGSAAKTGADLVLSYPTNGLVYETGLDPKTLLTKHYRKVECSHSLSHVHSTFGASKGPATST